MKRKRNYLLNDSLRGAVALILVIEPFLWGSFEELEGAVELLLGFGGGGGVLFAVEYTVDDAFEDVEEAPDLDGGAIR